MVRNVSVIRTRTAGDAAAYDALALESPATLFYASRRFTAFAADLLGATDATLVAEDEGRIVAALPLLRRDTEFGTLYNSLPYYGSNGGVIGSDEAARRALIEEWNAMVTAPDALGGTMIGNPLEGGAIANVAHNFTDYRIGQLTEIDGDVLAKIDPTARRNVQKAQRSGIEVFSDPSLLARLRELHVENMAAIGGLAKTERFFELIPKHFRFGEDYEIVGARKDGRVIATLLLFHFNRTVEYYTPAIEEAWRSDQPLSAVLIEAMRAAAARGFRWWNWGGTWPSQTGVYRFKRKWATLEQRYEYYVQMNRPELLEWPAKRFVGEFPGFYVVPFSALAGVEG
jgi:CelD/BcsL family acetyltransferase involved in cellulose biosynthesis